jgi:hypothetical protein
MAEHESELVRRARLLGAIDVARDNLTRAMDAYEAEVQSDVDTVVTYLKWEAES